MFISFTGTTILYSDGPNTSLIAIWSPAELLVSVKHCSQSSDAHTENGTPSEVATQYLGTAKPCLMIRK